MRQYAIGNYYSTLSTRGGWLMRDRPPWALSLEHRNHSYILHGFRYDAGQVFMMPIPYISYTTIWVSVHSKRAR